MRNAPSPCHARFFTLAALLALAAAPCGVRGADEPATPKTHLKAFLPHAGQQNTAQPTLLAGPWNGVFKHKNPDGTQGESTYIVTVNPTESTLEVSLITENTVKSSVADLDPYLQPTTKGPKLATWDGKTLQLSLHENMKQGVQTIDSKKALSLTLGRDARHAVFTYDIDVTSQHAGGSSVSSFHGSGVLTRPH